MNTIKVNIIKVSKEEAEILEKLLDDAAAARMALDIFVEKAFKCGKAFWEKARELHPEIKKTFPGWQYDDVTQEFYTGAKK